MNKKFKLPICPSLARLVLLIISIVITAFTQPATLQQGGRIFELNEKNK